MEGGHNYNHRLEKFWSTSVLFPALKALLDDTDAEPIKETSYGYGKIYFYLGFISYEPTLSVMLFNNTINNSIGKLYISRHTDGGIKLKDEKGRTAFDLDFFKSGGYGKLYTCKQAKEILCKTIRSGDIGKPDSINCILSEAIIHSILSCDERRPRVCSKFFGVKFEPSVLQSTIVFTELMHGPVHRIPELSLDVFKSVITQMADALDYLQGKYKFIHGDLKINNICYRKTYGKSYKFVMIDFGMSVMCYNNIEISSNMFIRRGYLDRLIFPNSGDLSLLSASLYEFFTCARDVISNLLIFPGEEESLISKYKISKNSTETYSICYGCHNPKTLPQTIIQLITSPSMSSSSDELALTSSSSS